MEIREIEGKKFIEFNEHKHQRKRLIVSIIFLILLATAIVTLINTTKTLIENKDIIIKDPLIYGMDVHGFVSCQCSDSEGKEWYSREHGFVNIEKGEGWINYSEFYSGLIVNFTFLEVE